MKKSLKIMLASAAAMLALAGCKSIPTPEAMKATSTAVGAAAGLVANETKIDDKARNAVIEIVGKVSSVTPDKGQTFEDAWTPVAKEVVAKLIAEGKLDDGTGQLALMAFGIAVKGIDYIFDIRYPKAREYEELVAAAIKGFTEGFLSTFTPANGDAVRATIPSPAPDEEALKWLREKAAAVKK